MSYVCFGVIQKYRGSKQKTKRIVYILIVYIFHSKSTNFI